MVSDIEWQARAVGGMNRQKMLFLIVSEKPDSCPNSAVLSKLKSRGCGTKCYGDDDCPADAKCCDAPGCGPVCTPPGEHKMS